MMTAKESPVPETKQQVLQLLWQHSCLKFSTIRGILRADRLELHTIMQSMEEEGLIKFQLEDHCKFSGYSLTTKGFDAVNNRSDTL